MAGLHGSGPRRASGASFRRECLTTQHIQYTIPFGKIILSRIRQRSCRRVWTPASSPRTQERHSWSYYVQVSGAWGQSEDEGTHYCSRRRRCETACLRGGTFFWKNPSPVEANTSVRLIILSSVLVRRSRPKVFAVAGIGAKTLHWLHTEVATRRRCDLQVLIGTCRDFRLSL
jgi:hypothetical protein